jgi:hypothetical protein
VVGPHAPTAVANGDRGSSNRRLKRQPVPTAVAKGGWTQPPLQMVVEAFFSFFWIFYVFGDFQLKN